jgi:hypothetical protein
MEKILSKYTKNGKVLFKYSKFKVVYNSYDLNIWFWLRAFKLENASGVTHQVPQ